jgi:hypothetical protein
MAEFNIRSDSVDVEQIMRQIRARIRDKRGVDYTEEQIQEMAKVKLERFLDPKGVRSDLVEQFHRMRVTSPDLPKYEFEDTTLYESTRGVVRLIRRLLQPVLKLFFNPNPLIQALHTQSDINAITQQRREELDALYYELIHNLVLELTRLGIETKNLKMRLESMASRLDFDERRARSLEGVVQFRPGTAAAREQAVAAPPAAEPEEEDEKAPEAPTPEAGSRPRRRRRRGRRGRHGAAGPGQAVGGAAAAGSTPSAPPTDTASAQTGPPSSGDGPGEGSDASGL